jgi:hypothetical protein
MDEQPVLQRIVDALAGEPVREVLADPAYRSAAAAVAAMIPAPGETSPAEDEIAALLPR